MSAGNRLIARAIRRRQAGFTLVEMLVVILVLVILISIVLAVGQQVRSSSQESLTRMELKNLQAALQWYQQKTGHTPSSMGDFLQGYQEMHAYQTGSTWQQNANVLSQLPSSMVVSGTVPAPGGSATMPAVIEILDAWGAPIEYVPPSPDSVPASTNFYPNDSTQHTNFTLGSGQAWVYVGGSSSTPSNPPYTPPSQDSHAPYFYSFGPQYHSNNLTTSDYLYSYAP